MTDITAISITTSAQPLRIVIPGGEGHLGRLLARRFSGQGHLVTTLSRSPRHSSVGAKRQTSEKLNAWETAIWDGKTPGPWVEHLENADILINLAGRSVDCRYTARNRAAILQSRVESTVVLGQAIESLKSPPRLWLNSSTATIYRHSLDRDMDEATGDLGGSEPGAPETWRFSIDVARQWERSFFASNTPRTRKIAFRSAMVMSVEPGAVFDVLIRLVRSRLGGAWGTGRQYMSWIHEQDFLRAIEFLIGREDIAGAVNLAAPGPLPNEQFLSHLRNAWGTRIGLPAAAWMLEIAAFFLRTETELLLKSRRVVPGILQNNGFEFLFPEWPDAAIELVRRWKAKAAIHESGISSKIVRRRPLSEPIKSPESGLTPVAQKFILHWGEMGTKWGINRTVAQVHALLFLSPKPLPADEISETLSVARSNVSTSLRELQGWGIVSLVHVLGDRRDHFQTTKDVWEIFRTVSEERKRREIDPTLRVLAECVQEIKSAPAGDAYTRERLESMLDFLTTMSGLFEEILRMPVGALKGVGKLRGKVITLLGSDKKKVG